MVRNNLHQIGGLNMDFRQLIYFITVVEHGTFTKAATALHVSQPSLSASIKKLEINTGLQLLKRNTRSLEVTKEGYIVYQEAKKLFHHYNHVNKEIQRLKQHGPQELSIGLIESANFWVPKILQRFRKTYPQAKIKLHEVLSLTDVEKSLHHFDIHLAITNQYVKSHDIEATPIYEEQLVAILPRKHRLLQKQTALEMKDFQDEAFIICKEGFQTRADILNAFNKAGITPAFAFEIERFETACRLVDEGLGITILPETYVKHEINGTYQIKSISDSNISRHVYIAYEKNHYLPPIVVHFIDLIKNFFSESD